MARTFAESGSNRIVILDLDKKMAETAAVELVEWFEEHGQAEKGEIQAIGLGCDVSNEQEVKDCFSTVVDKFGRVDVLVTAAGIVGASPLDSHSTPHGAALTVSWFLPAENFPATEYPADKFRKLMGINVEGSVLLPLSLRHCSQLTLSLDPQLVLLRPRGRQGHDEARRQGLDRPHRLHVGCRRQCVLLPLYCALEKARERRRREAVSSSRGGKRSERG